MRFLIIQAIAAIIESINAENIENVDNITINQIKRNNNFDKNQKIYKHPTNPPQ